MTEAWKQWEGQIVDGKFHLRRYLGGSADSAVYLTESVGSGPGNVAIKLVAADVATTPARLSRWRMAIKLSHPHLVRVFEVGTCRIAETDLLFVVMEYAEEDLSQILPLRPLSPDESRDMLDPVLDTLTYLHSQDFVHARLKPSNIMAVDNRLKISSDGLCPIGKTTSGFSKPSVYDSPESAKGGPLHPQADVWSLGVTLVDVLTQRLPQKNDHGEPLRLEAMPRPFLEIVRHCLRRNPQERWTVGEIKGYVQHLSTPEGVASSAAADAAETRTRTRKKWPFAVAVAAIALVALLLAGPRLLRKNPQAETQANAEVVAEAGASTETPKQPATQFATKPTAAPTVPAASSQNLPAASPPVVAPVSHHRDSNLKSGDDASSSDEIVHQVLPDVSRQARSTITGHVKVKVRVHVDPAGNVSDAHFDSAGPSEYFSRLALQAAREWKFSAAPGGVRQWQLRFEFGRAGTKVFAVREHS